MGSCMCGKREIRSDDKEVEIWGRKWKKVTYHLFVFTVIMCRVNVVKRLKYECNRETLWKVLNL